MERWMDGEVGELKSHRKMVRWRGGWKERRRDRGMEKWRDGGYGEGDMNGWRAGGVDLERY
jgi:hypothetical protein